MHRYDMHLVKVLLFFLFIISGCRPTERNAESLSQQRESGGDLGHADTQTSLSWQETLRQTTAAKRLALEEANRTYHGLLAERSPSERALMDGWGYPSPIDFARSLDESDETLEKKAQAGDKLAQALFADRMALRLEQILASGTDDKAQFYKDVGRGARQASMALRFSRTPFAAITYGRFSTASYGTPDAMAAGYKLAAEMGDTRASAAYEAFVRSNPAVKEDLVDRNVNTMKKVMGR